MPVLYSQDDNLKALVQNRGPNDWKYIASILPVSEFDGVQYIFSYIQLTIQIIQLKGSNIKYVLKACGFYFALNH